MSGTGMDVVPNTPSKITVGCCIFSGLLVILPLLTAPYNPNHNPVGHPDRHARTYEGAVVGVEIGGFAALASQRTLDSFLSVAAD